MDYYRRDIELSLLKSLEEFPVIAITGPRQCGKSTLVKQIVKGKTEGKFV
jgi:predicted AAA+ superfamily ATPase